MNKNQTAFKLLKLLSDGHFHSGETLAKSLQMTRSGVWKAANQLKALNIELHAVTGKGYRIPEGIEFLDETAIRSEFGEISTKKLSQLQTLSSVDSTNNYLLSLAKQAKDYNLAVTAEYQTAGRGRNGRTWTCSYASSLYQSLLWHFNKDSSELVGLSLAIGVCITRALRRYGIAEGLELKWPNDVMWQGKKLAGILIDLIAEPHGKCSVVIGVGLNVCLPYSFRKAITPPCTDIAEITQTKPKRNRLAGILLDEMINLLESFGQQGLAPFLEEWTTYDKMTNKTVTLKTLQGELSGIMQGISPKGELRLLTETGELRDFLSGDVSLRLARVP